MLGTRKTLVNEAEEVESFHSFNMCKWGSVQFLKGQWVDVRAHAIFHNELNLCLLGLHIIRVVLYPKALKL